MRHSDLCNTKTVVKRDGFQYVHYCVYCTQKAHSDQEWDHYDKYEFNFCDCPGAALEKQINELSKGLIINKKFINKVTFENEMIELRNKYGQK